jgi:hypothetical protein
MFFGIVNYGFSFPVNDPVFLWDDTVMIVGLIFTVNPRIILAGTDAD